MENVLFPQESIKQTTITEEQEVEIVGTIRNMYGDIVNIYKVPKNSCLRKYMRELKEKFKQSRL